jgi:hypothetical protein
MPPATTSSTAMPRMIDNGTPRLSDEIDCGAVECDGRLAVERALDGPLAVLDPEPAELLRERVDGG